MAYTPKLNIEYSGLLRRIAWAFGVPMTRAIEGIIECSTKYIDVKKVCEACRDRSFCELCLFKEKRQEVRYAGLNNHVERNH